MYRLSLTYASGYHAPRYHTRKSALLFPCLPALYARRMEPISTAETANHAPASTAARRPAELTAIYALALVLGAVGILGALSDTHELIGLESDGSSTAVFRSLEVDQAAAIYEEMNHRIAIARMPHRLRQTIFAVAHLTVSAGLLAGAVRGLRSTKTTNTILFAALCGGIFFELAHLMPSIRDAQQANTIMQQEAPRILRAFAGPGPSTGDDGIAPPTAELMRAGGKTAVLAMLASALFKCVFYCVGLRGLAQNHE